MTRHDNGSTKRIDDSLTKNRLIVLANREPYIHEHADEGIEVRRPASGLVTGIEPLLIASGGVWIAHGGGSADRDVVDDRSTVAVPPDEPSYSLRRIFLSEEEIAGYYEGFANEALWPLCHLAYTKPHFRRSDYDTYRDVNLKFVEATAEVCDDDSIVLIQDYHFALAAEMMRSRGIEAPIHLFWHITWPPPEVFRFCPWSEELLSGMLGADIVGFHSLGYCRNFLATCAAELDCEIDEDQLTVTRAGRTTR
ncbi:MAG: trehalose-6-phosphate synthase, partial [Thermoanaerobaculia bacterium]|nr:trehalose-6-phosphate synthase [Thermoanaerobaculia bacterium]